MEISSLVKHSKILMHCFSVWIVDSSGTFPYLIPKTNIHTVCRHTDFATAENGLLIGTIADFVNRMKTSSSGGQ